MRLQIQQNSYYHKQMTLVMNLFTCIWNPVTNALILNAALRNTLQSIVTAVVIGGVAMIIIFAVDDKIFAPGFEDRK